MLGKRKGPVLRNCLSQNCMNTFSILSFKKLDMPCKRKVPNEKFNLRGSVTNNGKNMHQQEWKLKVYSMNLR